MISVIVPIYNTIKYLPTCFDSILGQTYQNIEVILVDDGSTDGSGELCDEYAKKDSRVKVIHKENGGQAAARNRALDIAEGEYIGFVDSDDSIHPQMYSRLLKVMNNTEADMAVCDYLNVEEDYSFDETVTSLNRMISEDPVAEVLEGHDRYFLLTEVVARFAGPWCKLYRTELFEKNRFLEGTLHEDTRILPYLVIDSKRIALFDDKLYFYMCRQNSSTTKPLDSHRMFQLIDAMENECILVKAAQEYDVQRQVARHTCNFIMFYYDEVKKAGIGELRECRSRLREEFKKTMEINRNVFGIKQVTYQLFRVSPRLGIMFRKLRDKL